MRVRAAVLLILLLAACGGGAPGEDPPPGPLPPGDPQPPAPAGGVLATFTAAGETFRVFVTNEATIQQLFDLSDGISQATIPSGAFRLGPGEADHNLPWSWHMDPEDIAMVELAIEVCDGSPSIVENDLAGYLAVGRYCPWDATLVALEDLR